MTSGAPLLAVSGLVVRYGAVTAVREVDLQVDEGEIVSIVGPNGAGKTSLILTVAGIIAPAAGTVIFAGRTLGGIALEDVVAQGIALVPEGRHIFASLTVMENLLLGATVRRDSRAVAADLDRFFAMFPILAERRRQPAGQLSGGEQQQLAIARALLSRPRLLMLDEPSLGLAPMVVDQIYALLSTIRTQGVTILLVEQNAERVFGICQPRLRDERRKVCSRRRRCRNQKPSALRRRLFRRAHARGGKRTVMERLVQILADAVSVGSLYALTALGIGLIFGVMRLINFAHGELITFAAYTLLALFGQPVPIMIFGGIAVAVVLALVTERAAFRPLRNADPTTLLISSFAVSFFLQKLLILVVGSRLKGLDFLPELGRQIEFAGIRLQLLQIVTIIVGIVLLAALTWFLRATRLGLHMRAAAEDFRMARVLGVRANKVIAVAFALSGILAAAVSCLIVVQTGVVQPRMGLQLVIIAFVGTVIGGLGSLSGAALGGFLVGAATILLQAFLPPDLRAFREAFVFIAVALVLLFRPQGLIPARGLKERI